MKHTHLFPKQKFSFNFPMYLCLILFFIFFRNTGPESSVRYIPAQIILCFSHENWGITVLNYIVLVPYFHRTPRRI
jgi:hypothetical protein